MYCVISVVFYVCVVLLITRTSSFLLGLYNNVLTLSVCVCVRASSIFISRCTARNIVATLHFSPKLCVCACGRVVICHCCEDLLAESHNFKGLFEGKNLVLRVQVGSRLGLVILLWLRWVTKDCVMSVRVLTAIERSVCVCVCSPPYASDPRPLPLCVC